MGTAKAALKRLGELQEQLLRKKITEHRQVKEIRESRNNQQKRIKKVRENTNL